MNILSSIFVSLAGVSNALMDNSAENNFPDNKYNKSDGDNNDENKWKQPVRPSKRKWYYLWILYKPKYEEKFIWSSTILVSLTDWWHKFQFLMITFFCLAIICYVPFTLFLVKMFGWKMYLVPILDFIWYRGLFSASFETVYKNLKNKLSKS